MLQSGFRHRLSCANSFSAGHVDVLPPTRRSASAIWPPLDFSLVVTRRLPAGCGELVREIRVVKSAFRIVAYANVSSVGRVGVRAVTISISTVASLVFPPTPDAPAGTTERFSFLKLVALRPPPERWGCRPTGSPRVPLYSLPGNALSPLHAEPPHMYPMRCRHLRRGRASATGINGANDRDCSTRQPAYLSLSVPI